MCRACGVDDFLGVLEDIPSVDLPTKIIAKVECDENMMQNAIVSAFHRLDFVPVVRCKDCIYFHPSLEECSCQSADPFEYWSVDGNDYCSQGIRTDENE